jgi:hypothetical protein
MVTVFCYGRENFVAAGYLSDEWKRDGKTVRFGWFKNPIGDDAISYSFVCLWFAIFALVKVYSIGRPK